MKDNSRNQFIVVIAACCLACSLSAQPTYRIEHIPGLARNYGVRISDAGHVVAGHYLWYNGALVDIGGSQIVVEDVNIHGQVVGRVRDSSRVSNAFVWQNGIMTTLPTLGGSDGFATAINNLGEVVGFTDNIAAGSVVNYRATYWPTPSVAQDLGTVGSDHSSRAWAISNPGQIGAISLPSTGSGYGQDAFLWDSGVITPFIENDRDFTIDDINDLGHMVGYVWHTAYLWDGTALHDLGTLGGSFSSAYGINNHGEIVGSAETSSSDLRAFYCTGGKMTLLSDLVEDMADWQYLQIAYDINESGQIVGIGRHVSSFADTEVFLLTPIANPPVIMTTTLDPAVLWPPNGQMVKVDISAVVSDGDGSVELEVMKIECDEPHSLSDYKILDNQTVALRANRNGQGSGRTYTLYLRAKDQAGQTSEMVTAAVVVPHDKAD